ncbi:MAG: histidine phosphatase family protein [Proteobacteria bacterium]|nr:histidine phosphatase family protein [Pseudomonadota bacterium]
MRRLFLCRHGQTSWNANGQIQGLTDIGLSDEGFRQAERLGVILASTAIKAARIVTSPLMRARQTAEVLHEVLGGTLQHDENLLEVDTGQFTGKTFQALRDDPQWHAHLADPCRVGYGLTGESAESVRHRVQQAVASHVPAHDAGAGEDVIFVSHACPIRHIIMLLLDIPPKHLYHISVANASATLFEIHADFAKVVFMNRTG